MAKLALEASCFWSISLLLLQKKNKVLTQIVSKFACPSISRILYNVYEIFATTAAQFATNKYLIAKKVAI